MSQIDRKAIVSALEACGFTKSATNKGILVLSEASEVSAGYCLNIVRKGGMAHFGGGLGVYFKDFEDEWKDSLSRSEKMIDFTLPLVMHIDNFVRLLDDDFFEYTDDLTKISKNAKSIYELSQRLPLSVEQFNRSLMSCLLLGKRISDYLHIADYNQEDNLYFRKSAFFISWLVEKHPQCRGHIYNCLTGRQKQRLALPLR